MENQPKQVISFRVSVAEMSALEALQQPEDSSISKTALRLLQGLLGVQDSPSVNVVNANEIRGRVEGLEERLNGAIITREQLSDFVNDIVDKRIQHLADALSDHENRFISIEQAQEARSHSSVTPEVTDKDIASLMPQDKESPIAPKPTEALKPNCPHCGGQTNRHGKGKSGNPRFKCKSCGKTFEEWAK